MDYCEHCGREIRKGWSHASWYHVHSKRVACDKGWGGRIRLAWPGKN